MRRKGQEVQPKERKGVRLGEERQGTRCVTSLHLIGGKSGSSYSPLLGALARLPDPRRVNKSHPLPAILALCVCGMLCGCRSLLAIHEWGRSHGASLAKVLGFHRPVPCVATLAAVLRLVEASRLEEILADWFAGFSPKIGDKHGRRHVAIDGKTLRAMQGHADLPALALVAAFAVEQGTVLDEQAMVDSDELGAVRWLLERLPLDGVLITGDAQQTQHDASTTIVQEGAYVFTVKDNQPKLLDQIYEAVAKDPSPQVACEQGKRGNRHEKRTLTLTSAEGVNWPFAAHVALLDRDVYEDGSVRCETVAIVTSLLAKQLDALTLLRLVQSHWGIENSLHWVRDVTMGEDACRVRKGQAPQVLVALRNTVVGLIRSTDRRQIASAMRHFSIHVSDALALVGLRES